MATIDRKTNKERKIYLLKSKWTNKQTTNTTTILYQQYVLMESRNISCIYVHLCAQGKGIEAKMQSQVQNFLATGKKIEYTLIVLCVILTYQTGYMYIYFV